MKVKEKRRYPIGENRIYDDHFDRRVKKSDILNGVRGNLARPLVTMHDLIGEDKSLENWMYNIQYDLDAIKERFADRGGIDKRRKMDNVIHEEMSIMESRLDYFQMEREALAVMIDKENEMYKKSYGRDNPLLKR